MEKGEAKGGYGSNKVEHVSLRQDYGKPSNEKKAWPSLIQIVSLTLTWHIHCEIRILLLLYLELFLVSLSS